jgi:hypothetical protein
LWCSAALLNQLLRGADLRRADATARYARGGTRLPPITVALGKSRSRPVRVPLKLSTNSNVRQRDVGRCVHVERAAIVEGLEDTRGVAGHAGDHLVVQSVEMVCGMKPCLMARSACSQLM